MANVLQFTVNFFRDFEAPLDGVIVGPEKVNKISALLGTANPVGMRLNVWAREGSAFVYRIKITRRVHGGWITVHHNDVDFETYSKFMDIAFGLDTLEADDYMLVTESKWYDKYYTSSGKWQNMNFRDGHAFRRIEKRRGTEYF